MSYSKRLALLVGMDSLIVLFSVYVGYYFLNPYFGIFTSKMLLISSITLLITHHIFSFIYRLYHKVWSYASIGEVIAIVKVVSFSIISAAIVQSVVLGNIYVRVLFLTWLLHICLIGGSRFSWRLSRDKLVKSSIVKENTLIVGAGAAGTMLVRHLLKNHDHELQPVAFVDDDLNKHKLDIYGTPVVGSTNDIPEIVERYRIKHIILAIPSLNKHRMQTIYQQCSKTNATTKIVPMLEDIITGKVSVQQFRDVQVEDLLGRDPVELDTQSISEKLSNKTVLVTGAGGSIGSEICRQVSKFKPKRLLLLGHGENSIYTIDMELRNTIDKNIEIIPIIADVQDRERIQQVMDDYQPDVVYHAAAHKHVPLMEYNPKEAVKNNIIGTKNVAEAADLAQVTTFVLVSTDKAVNPTNVMGSTKRIAEMIIQDIDKRSNTKFVAVRFGNVLGSRGSVIPLFKKQIKAGGPLTVTHPEMTRYFMTIPEASRLVLQAGTLAQGGEIFVLDMGQPVKIVDLATNLINLSGYSLEEIGIKYSGMRPGEKMYEELLDRDEIIGEAIFPKILVGRSLQIDFAKITYLIDNYILLNDKKIREYVLEIANKRSSETVSLTN
ncbi:NDP-sugar epimerase, includes UDP-GlcNAc-inverting 4,6-dehydratase FlaA1 and capsular polysaccharide biosynthesis protein EpsC [Terribacillus halophilus]|uniref:NDP-sugar epimerase, includes UDP-GlcNAc-inverting 4,6-dehydratase FlaA1 and capsular polysaccharide biosynthesis protein EpsC n=1 Tax=Terribacillus halophilus TaxID=361279 RepID=A0A1G6IKC6_9BACI|nr:nucleoside-diphosphate sugar epimerase/dehydratase [Terribacillus halophilus]SDC06891.1 NDP-sugar epimerase, includes UDP-GlcNAc-inverting 4,6-dehydratase FlaA1 and capsular polysaccharide biosynthesis protein EpsC [Terribacillus halophilus]